MGKKDIKDELFTIANECIKIKKQLAITPHLTPVNFEEEREKFFKSRTYNPQFVYVVKDIKNHEKKILDLKSKILKLDIPQDLNDYLLDYIVDLELLNHTRKTIGTSLFADYATDLFANELEETFHEQFIPKDFEFENESRGSLMDAHEIKKAFEKTLHNYHLKDYEVEIIPNGPIITAGPHRIVMGEKIKRYENNVNCLIIHEVESHALQFYNVRESDNPLISLIKFSKVRVWSEGLAVFNEVQTKLLTKSKYNTYLKRFEAVKMINNSFREIYEYISESMPPKEAYKVAFRVKRGLSDTSLPGGFPKDLVYILGYLKVSGYVKKGNSRAHFYRVQDPEYGELLKKHGLLPTNPIILPKFIS